MCKVVGLARRVWTVKALSGLSCACAQLQSGTCLPQTWLKTQVRRALALSICWSWRSPLSPITPLCHSLLQITQPPATVAAQFTPAELGRGAAPDQTPKVLTWIQQFFKYKCFSDCCMPLLNFQNAEMVAFVNLVQLYRCFLGGKDLLTSLLSHTWKSCQ